MAIADELKRSRAQRRKIRRNRAVQARGGIYRSLSAPLYKDIHSFTRMVQFTLTGAVANPAYGVATFALNALPNYAEFTSLFDRYRINFVKLFWQLNVAPEAQAAASSQYPRLYTFNDFTDVTTPTSMDEFRERQKTKMQMLSPRRPVITTCRPAVEMEAYKTLGGVAVNAPKWKVWLPQESPDVQHLGTKYAIENFTNTNYTITLTAKYYLSCKNVK